MKTKEQWLEEFDKEMLIGIDLDEIESKIGWWETSGQCEFGKARKEEVCRWLSNALEQYAKEYCLGVIERATKNIPTSMITKAYFLSGIQEAESAMKKEIGV